MALASATTASLVHARAWRDVTGRTSYDDGELGMRVEWGQLADGTVEMQIPTGLLRNGEDAEAWYPNADVDPRIRAAIVESRVARRAHRITEFEVP